MICLCTVQSLIKGTEGKKPHAYTHTRWSMMNEVYK